MRISNKIEQYKVQILDRWHTPGHKGALWVDDITEVDDGLVFPDDEIIKAQNDVATFYGAKHLRFLTAGSSMGVKAAIIAADGDIVTFSNAHQSVYEAAALNKVKVHTVELEKKDGLLVQPSLSLVEKTLEMYKDIKAIVITSPDYFGRVVTKDVLDVVRSFNKLLIVDSAHGAHFPLVDALKDKSFANAADLCNLSAHKTLFAMTMGAYLCVNNDALLERADEALKNLGTTSPLYPLLASLEAAPIIGSAVKGNYELINRCVNELKEDIPLIETDDFTRITVDAQRLMGGTGKELFDILFKTHQIAAEMYYDRYLVFIATHSDDESKFFRLRAALMDVKNERGFKA